MKRRRFGKLGLAVGGVSIGSVVNAADKKAVAKIAERSRFEPGKEIEIELQSHPVKWRDSEVHLLRFNRLRFDLDEETSTLTAELKGGVITFDQVDYEVSGAVFDEAGGLLGAGRSMCQVQRRWLGRTALMKRELLLNFGASLDFSKARSFQLSISRQVVLTPEQWSKQK